ncbi:MAG: histidinol dehydrogenase, partial [Acidobacteria bacterium]|nr:histidinol dehydrogenase [Acidobacteriota bacterium]
MRVLSTKGRKAEEVYALLGRLTSRTDASYERAMPVARRIVESVRKGGDAALLRQRTKLDGIPASEPIEITFEEMEAAWRETSTELRSAMKLAMNNPGR